MKFKAKKGTPAYESMMKLEILAIEAVEKARQFANEFGCDEYYASRRARWGGVEALVFKNVDDIPNGWRPFKEGKGFSMKPDLRSKEGKKYHERIKDLPIVDADTLNKHCGLSSLEWYRSPGVDLLSEDPNREYVVIILDEKWETLPTIEGWVEITTTEYNQLKAATA